MNIFLTPQLEAYLKTKLAKGMYASASEVVQEALQLLEERDALQAMKLQALLADINQGLTSLDNDQGKPLDVNAIKVRGRKSLARQG